MTGTKWLFLILCMGLTAGCGQGAVGWMALGGVCLAIAGCVRRPEEPATEPVEMTAIDAEPADAPGADPVAEATAVEAPPVEALQTIEAPSEPAVVAEAPRRPIRARVRPRVTPPEPAGDDVRFAHGISRAAPNWHRSMQAPIVVEREEEKARPVIAPIGIRSRAGGRWENER
jgi:hypothetical protein